MHYLSSNQALTDLDSLEQDSMHHLPTKHEHFAHSHQTTTSDTQGGAVPFVYELLK